jgi:CubicO group peptidase (beta-lactamase class C family)
MKLAIAVALVLLLAAARATDAAAVSEPSLVGLWRATHLLDGPEIRGTLVLKHDASSWNAYILGQQAPVEIRGGGAVAFALPGGMGSFSGRFEDQRRAIFGHWIQPPTNDSGTRYASPVTLKFDGANTWSGLVDPLDDRMTFYLVVKPAPPGSATGTNPAFMLNPERNLGWVWRVNGIERNAFALTLLTARGRDQPTGVYRSQDDLLSFYFSGRGGTYDFERLPENAWTDFYARSRPNQKYAYSPPIANHDGWRVGSLADVGISQTAIETFVQNVIDAPIDSEHAPQIHAILIARRGRLVLDEYFHGLNRDRPHDPRSASKSITSTLFGAAVQAGLSVSTSTHVYSAMNGGKNPPNLDPLKRSLTVESLLTMSSGLDCDDNDESSPGNEDNVTQDPTRPDIYRSTLDLNMIRPPGSKWAYCSVGANLIGGILTRVSHESLPNLFHDLLAEPLQIVHYYLPLQPTGEAYMAGGLRLLPRDFMKFGQLMLDGGTWNGHRILSRQWCEHASSPLVDIPGFSPVAPAFDVRYGYLWWVINYPYKGASLRAFAMWGNGGQFVMVVPKLNLVMEILTGNYADGPIDRTIQQTYFPRYVLPAILN